MTASAKSAPKSATFTKPAACRSSRDDLRATAAEASGPSCSEKQVGGGGRNARATSLAHALLDVFPPATRSHGSPAATSPAAIIRQAQELSRFAEPTLIQIVAPCN